jgi:hypothetical protein
MRSQGSYQITAVHHRILKLSPEAARKMQNGAQLPGCYIAQNSNLGGAESGTCGIKAIIAQGKPQGLGGLLGDPPKDVVQTDASAVWHNTSW